MKQVRVYGVAAGIALLAAVGCSSSGGAESNAGLPAGGMHDSVKKTAHGDITEYLIPRPAKNVPKTLPIGITTGPDGAVWFAERGLGKLGRIDLKTKIIAQFRLKGQARFPQNLVTGPDGNFWVAAGSTRTWRAQNEGPDPYAAIIRATPAGEQIGTFPLPMESDPRSITPGPDGALWFTETSGFIGRITTEGELKQFPIPHHNMAFGITIGPDGNLWFCELFNDKVVRITTSGKIKIITFPKHSGPTHIVAGPDGYLYVTEKFSSQVAQLTTAGTIMQQFNLSPGSYLEGIAAGSDGNLYVTEMGSGKIAQVTLPNGSVTEFDPPTPNSRPWKIAAGPDGNIWFTESAAGKIGKVTI